MSFLQRSHRKYSRAALQLHLTLEGHEVVICEIETVDTLIFTSSWIVFYEHVTGNKSVAPLFHLTSTGFMVSDLMIFFTSQLFSWVDYYVITLHPSLVTDHPSVIYTAYPVWGRWGAGTDPSCRWARGGIHPRPFSHSADTQRQTVILTPTTIDYLETPINLSSMSLDSRRKLSAKNTHMR